MAPVSQGVTCNPEVLPLMKLYFSVATFTSVGHLQTLYQDKNIDALGNREELENGAFTLKDLTLYLGKGSIYLQNCWKIHKFNIHYY